MAAISRQNTQTVGLIARLTDVISDLKRQWAFYRVYRTTYAELSGLSARELGDLGLSRGDLRRVALEAASGNQRPHSPH
ncbi:MAG: DUF1127 domain-containing protein [Pseudomonadota bacterium]